MIRAKYGTCGGTGALDELNAESPELLQVRLGGSEQFVAVRGQRIRGEGDADIR